MHETASIIAKFNSIIKMLNENNKINTLFLFPLISMQIIINLMLHTLAFDGVVQWYKTVEFSHL